MFEKKRGERMLNENEITLAGLQKYTAVIEKERGFDHETDLQKCLLLGEEVGELFKAVRKREGVKTAADSASHSVADELADILMYVAAIANRYGVDLNEALRVKEARNRKREWK